MSVQRLNAQLVARGDFLRRNHELGRRVASVPYRFFHGCQSRDVRQIKARGRTRRGRAPAISLPTHWIRDTNDRCDHGHFEADNKVLKRASHRGQDTLMLETARVNNENKES